MSCARLSAISHHWILKKPTIELMRSDGSTPDPTCFVPSSQRRRLSISSQTACSPRPTPEGSCSSIIVAHNAGPTGGHVDPSEHPADAASPEILGELGISPSFHPTTGDAPLMVTVTETAGQSLSHTDVGLWSAFDGSTEAPLSPDAR